MPLAEAQIALGKQNTCCRYEAGICPVPKSRKISLKSGNWLLSYGQNDFNMAVVCRRRLLSFKCAVLYQISSKSYDFFVEICRFNDFQDGGRLSILNFRHLDLICHVTSIAMRFCSPVQNLTRLLRYGKKNIF